MLMRICKPSKLEIAMNPDDEFTRLTKTFLCKYYDHFAIQTTKTFTAKMIRSIKFSSNILRNSCQQLMRKYSDQPARVEKTVNTVTLLGRVGNEPQKRGNEEHPVVTFSVATHNNYKYENGDWAQRTDWHRVVVFKPALRDSVLNYLKKGQRTLITGKISYGEIVDQEGKPRLSTSIIADDVVFFQSN